VFRFGSRFIGSGFAVSDVRRVRGIEQGTSKPAQNVNTNREARTEKRERLVIIVPFVVNQLQ
jgi:hypothetical protein